MSPILGIFASQISGRLTPTTGFVSISTVTVGAGGSSAVDFTNIPSVYKHLQVRILSSSPSSSGSGTFRAGNGSIDTGNNYATHYIYGGGGGPLAAGADTSVSFMYALGGTNSSTIFSSSIIDILDYTNTNKNKTFRTTYGFDRNGSGDIVFASGLWQNTAAITNLRFVSLAGNIGQFSSFALYGIQG